ncbi:hypothetical protein GCM10010988_00010 [Cnuibacter physcomitrellae]|nr:hypothetical protein GCM10010988_00010 [Cnuibacter physcomitrellae]
MRMAEDTTEPAEGDGSKRRHSVPPERARQARDDKRPASGRQGRSDSAGDDSRPSRGRPATGRPSAASKPRFGAGSAQRRSRDGEGRPGDSDRRPRDGEGRPSYGDRDRGSRDGQGRGGYGDRRPRDGDRRPSYGDRDRGPRDGQGRGGYGDRRPRDGEGRPSYGDRGPRERQGRPSYGDRDRGSREGQGRPSYGDRDRGSREGQGRSSYGDRDRGSREGQGRGSREGQGRPSYGDRDRGSRDGQGRGGYGDRRPRDGERRPSYGDRDRAPREGQGRPGGDRGRGGRDEQRLWTRGGNPARGDRSASRFEPRELTEAELEARALRSVRTRHDDPEIPDDVTPRDLDNVARNELKTLNKENAEAVARHLVMTGRLIEEDPQLAHRHAISASRRAGRIAVVRETVAITAYSIGEYAMALRELRTYRRLSGSNEQLALMIDSERGLGRPDKALEEGRSVDRSTLSTTAQVAVAIAMSGARLDLGDAEGALHELEIPQLDPNMAYSWSPDLFHAYAEVLEELGREGEADQWRERAETAERALTGEDDTVDVFEEEIEAEFADELDAETEEETDGTVQPELDD